MRYLKKTLEIIIQNFCSIHRYKYCSFCCQQSCHWILNVVTNNPSAFLQTWICCHANYYPRINFSAVTSFLCHYLLTESSWPFRQQTECWSSACTLVFKGTLPSTKMFKRRILHASERGSVSEKPKSILNVHCNTIMY